MISVNFHLISNTFQKGEVIVYIIQEYNSFTIATKIVQLPQDNVAIHLWAPQAVGHSLLLRCEMLYYLFKFPKRLPIRRKFSHLSTTVPDSTFPSARINPPGQDKPSQITCSRISYHHSFLYHLSLLDPSHQQLIMVNSCIFLKNKTNKKHLVINPHPSPATTTFPFSLYSKIP